VNLSEAVRSSVTRSPTGNVLGTTYHKLYCTF